MVLGMEKYTDFNVKNVQRIKGNYGFRVVLIYADGSSKTQQHAGFATQKEAQEARDITKAELIQRTYLVYGSTLFKDYITHWLEDDIKKRVKSNNTYYSYKNVAKNHLIPALGNKMMKAINTADIYRLYNKLNKISKSVARQARVIMKTCLGFAVSERAVKVNVALGASLPKNRDCKGYHIREIDVKKTLTHDEVMRLIDGSVGTPLHLMILFNVVMGLRCSEIIGLKYSDVDFIKQELHITRQLGRDINKDDGELPPKTFTKQELLPKTKSSVRTIAIPDIVYNAILDERKQYEAHKNRRKREFQDLDYICCSTYGRPRSKNYHFEPFKSLLKSLDLPDVRWHDLRGTCATQLLLAGMSPKAVAKNLGHAKEIVTCNNYIDNTKLTVIKLDRLDDYITSVAPPEKETDGGNCVDLSGYVIDINDYIP